MEILMEMNSDQRTDVGLVVWTALVLGGQKVENLEIQWVVLKV